ncbi:hypothetical protein BOTCAL_0551g00060 [Botryotinia calthae]|uniref:Uncharacterized protein n=1 Tax=Botryotinia calthae TaxID=38488 RepID=A0A4Y8CK20_9HELO|nr:hypothetical protein BOTCAL_0551g00060 [Botryotinia calthae]
MLINTVIRYTGSVNASDAATVNTHHQSKSPNILINQEANESARPSSDQVQEAEAQNIHQCEILDTPDISKDLENSTSTTIQQIENTRTNASIEFDNADAHEIDKVINGSTANVENVKTENEKLGIQNTKKRKPANDSVSSTSNSKRTQSISSEAASVALYDDHFFLAPSKNARIASKSTSKKRTGGSEEVLIEQLMAMDSDGRDNLEDKANDILTALRKTRLRLRKINKKKSEEKCDSTDEKEDGVEEIQDGVEETQDLMIDPRLHES